MKTLSTLKPTIAATAAAVLCCLACACTKTSRTEMPGDDTGTLSIVPGELRILGGQKFKLEAETDGFTDQNITIFWGSDDPSIVTVDENGEITAHNQGHTIITARAGKASAECNIEVYVPEPGDYFFADGTTSSELSGKKPVGIVFWTGNPGAEDKALRREHPLCTHGLVVSIEETECSWQYNYPGNGKTVGKWVSANTDEYESITTGTGLGDPLNRINGYNNTKALELYNAAPENKDWTTEITEELLKFRSSTASVPNTSGWYIPSVKELALLCNNDLPANIWGIQAGTETLELINSRIAQIADAPKIEGLYWSSNEGSDVDVYDINMYFGDIYYAEKDFDDKVRFVFAF